MLWALGERCALSRDHVLPPFTVQALPAHSCPGQGSSTREPVAAGEVLYHWRVFPVRLDEPPVVALSGSAEGQHPEAAMGLEETAVLLKAPAQSLGGALAQGGASRVAGEEQPGSELCSAWPPGRGLEEGPVVYRC